MKTAWLVVNGYLKSEKFEEIYSWLIEAAKERNINLKSCLMTSLIQLFRQILKI